jgi:arabinogalactan endo-1,4-beta-galactosidase
MMRKYFILMFGLLVILQSCAKAETPISNTSIALDTIVYPYSLPNQFIKGADISWVTEMENAGVSFYNKQGIKKDCFELMKDLGFNTIRLRVWVNPKDGYCNTADMLAKAKRAKALGFKLLIDFHYSDSWADPGKQNMPDEWKGNTISVLETAIYNHTFEVLSTLKNNQIIPEFVQIGNETNDGMLWEVGRASKNMDTFSKFIDAGYRAVKKIDLSIGVIVHISNGYDKNLFNWMFEGLKKYKTRFDIIGMSLYPEAKNWNSYNQLCQENIQELYSKFNKPTMLCEIGFNYANPETGKLFIGDLKNRILKLPRSQALGIMYWEPQAYNWKNYGLGAFDTSGKPTQMLDPFSN